MNWIVRNMKWIMIVSGLLTCTMIYAAIAPEAALQSTFGDSLNGPVAEIVVRNWGALITMIGIMLIYGAYNPQFRGLILTVAGLGKIIFIALVFAYGTQYLGKARVPVVIDSIMVLLFCSYLIKVRDHHLLAEKERI